MGDLCLVHAPWRELNAVDAEKLKKVPDGLTPSVPRQKIPGRGRNGRVGKHESFVCWFGLLVRMHHYEVSICTLNSFLLLSSFQDAQLLCSFQQEIMEDSGIVYSMYSRQFCMEGFTIHKFVQHRRSKSFRTFSPFETLPFGMANMRLGDNALT